MFYNAIAFNNGNGSAVVGTLTWTTSAVTNMASMFQLCSACYLNLSTWNVTLITIAASRAAFNTGAVNMIIPNFTV